MFPSRRAAPVRWLGRQLTRVGARCQWWRLLLPAEVCFRASIRLSGEVSWAIRLGRIQEARKRWAAAEATYARCLGLVDRSPADEHRRAGIHFRQARARAGREDWDGAQAALAEAVRLRPEVAPWHAHRAQAYEHLAGWAAAAGCYQEATRVEPHQPGWLTGLVRTNLKARRVPEAIEAGEAALAHVPGHPPLRRALADAYEVMGDWAAAAALLRELVAGGPDSHALRAKLAGCLEKLSQVPFEITNGGVALLPPEQRRHRTEAAHDELVEQLRELAERPPQRANDAFRLGQVYERGGQLASAADTYQLALDRLTTTDSWWCLKAAYDWEFRLQYVRAQMSSAPPPSGQLGRWVFPTTHGSAGTPAPPGGFFDALMAREGLRISGFLLPGQPAGTVAIHVDGELLKQVRVNSASWRPTFRYDLSRGVLRDFPERCRLTVRAGDRLLVTVGAADAVQVEVPDGTGKIGAKLTAGLAPNKKGSWPLTGTRYTDRQQRYLEVYDQVRQALGRQGRPLFLSYGTLLGYRRDGGFIPGDDDFDVAYASHAPDPETFRRECRQVALELIRQGFDVGFAINGRMSTVGHGGVRIDVSPFWFYRGRAWSFAAHDLEPEAFEPVQSGRFLDREVQLPRNIDALLADAYGPDWRTPQPSFRHYRPAADNQVLSTMWARPSEVREFIRLAAAERARHASAGRFVGVGEPAYPGFNRLVPAAAASPPPTGAEPVMASGDPAAGAR